MSDAIKDVSSGLVYEPGIYEGLPGFRITHPNGNTTFLYMNPSTESDDGKPTVFIYESAAEDAERPNPGFDHPHCYVTPEVSR